MNDIRLIRKRYMMIVIAAAAIIAAAFYLIPKVDGRRAAANAGPEEQTATNEVDYYTCSMHSSVKSPDPGNCPICGMKLVPVMKKGAVPKPESESDLTFHVSPAKQQLIGVKMAVVEPRRLQKVIRAPGRLDYDERKAAIINLKLSGWIKELQVDYTGQLVRRGQPLFTIYSPELVSAQEEYLQALKFVRNSQHAAIAKSDTPAFSTHQTIAPVSKPGDSTGVPFSADEVLQTAKQRLLIWDVTPKQIAELESSGEAQTYFPILSPVDGQVIEKMAVAGMYVEPGMALYRLSDLSTLWVYADVYEYELPFVKVGQEAKIKLSYFSSEQFTAKITFIYPFLNANTRTARVRMDIPSYGGKLKPEMYGDVEISIDLGERLAVPAGAVMSTGVRQLAFVDKGKGIFEMREIKLGVRAEGFNEVLEGLKPGEQVVASANFLIDAESKLQGVLQRLEGSGMATEQHRH